LVLAISLLVSGTGLWCKEANAESPQEPSPQREAFARATARSAAQPPPALASAGTAVRPSNLAAASVFQPFLERMWRSSSTFNAQCTRLAAAQRLKVVLGLEEPQRRPTFSARSVFERQDGVLVSANVFLPPTPDAVELIAHEVEHVLEQLDGVDLEAQAGSGHVWKRADGAFETRRATEVGRRVAREVELASGALLLAGARIGSPQTIGGQFVTLVQRDGLARPLDAPSARVSAHGRHVVFASYARLVPEDTNHLRDVYVLDLRTGQLTLESPGARGTAANGESGSPGISGDGRYVVFVSSAGNLADTQIPPGMPRVFLRDRETETTRLLATSATGDPANGYSGNPAISADGTTIVFESPATDLVDGAHAAGNSVGVYLVRRSSGTPVRLSVSSAGDVPEGQSVSPTVSADGRYVAFMSRADLTCAGDPLCPREPADKNGVADVYLRDTATNTTTRVSRGHSGRDADGPSYDPAISGDGRYVAFVSEASNLTRNASRHAANVYVRDMVTGVTELVSRNPSGRQANGPSVHPALSHDGSTVAFQSLASDLLCQDRCHIGQRDINLVSDVFVLDRRTGRTRRASADGGEEWMEGSRAPSLDDAGGVIVFASRHPLNDRDQAHDEDLYVRLAWW
jgi:Tol biopolymer transport system component